MGDADAPAKAGTILVVEDAAAIRLLVAEVLGEEGYEVAQASDGAQALTYLQQQAAPDMILLDLMMPGLSGQEFRRIQLRHARWARIPTVILTGDRQVTGHLAELAPAECLAKPIRLDHLLATVARHIRTPMPR